MKIPKEVIISRKSETDNKYNVKKGLKVKR